MQPTQQLSLYDLVGYRIATKHHRRAQAILVGIFLIALIPVLLASIGSWFHVDVTVLIICIVVMAVMLIIAIRNVLEWRSKQFCRHCGTPTSCSFGKHIDSWCRGCERLNDAAQLFGSPQGEMLFTNEILDRQSGREPVAGSLSMIILLTLSERANVIRIDWFPLRVRVRYCATGSKLKAVPWLYHLGRPLVQVAKAAAHLDFHREDVNQSGSVQLHVGDARIEMHVNVHPTQWGEQVLVRFEPTEALPHASTEAAKALRQRWGDWSPPTEDEI